MYAAYVDRESVIDEYPHVIVASEIKGLAFFVFELRPELHGKPIIMRNPFTSGPVRLNSVLGTWSFGRSRNLKLSSGKKKAVSYWNSPSAFFVNVRL